MERRRRAAKLNVNMNNNMEGDMLVARQQKWGTSAGSSSSSGSSSNSDSDSSASKTIQYPPLRFTCDLDHFQFACKDIRLSFSGGCKPYSLSAFWFSDGKKDQATWVELKEETWDDSFQWSILAPVSSQLLFTITDAKGSTITSEDAINVLSNGKGMSQDTWCQYTYNSAPIPTADIDGSHKYAWNASSIDTDGDGDGDDGVASSSAAGITSTTPDGTATSSYASKVTASNSVDTNATDLNDKSTTISKAIHDANQAKTIEGVLAALLGVSLIAMFALLYLFIKTRRRLREARSQLATRLDSQGGDGHGGMMEKSGAGNPFRGAGGVAGGGGFYSPSSGVITPRAGRNGELRNPFDDASAVYMNPQQPRSPFLGSAADNERARQSVTSLISAVPSSNAGRSTAGNSAISTEFYNTYKASTMPPSQSKEHNGSGNAFGGVMRSLFAPMSFFSSATPSPNPSTRAGSRSNASVVSAGGSGGDTSTLNTEYYGDRNGALSRPETTRTTSEGTIHDGISDSVITRQSTRSEFTSSSSMSGNHLDPSSAGRSSATRRASLSSSSSGNGGDISSMAPSQSEDVYPDSDAASFSNFSFVDTRSVDFDDDYADGRGGRAGNAIGAGSSDEGSTTVVEPPRNPFREPSPGESFNKRRSWNQSRDYTALNKEFSDSTSSFGP